MIRSSGDSSAPFRGDSAISEFRQFARMTAISRAEKTVQRAAPIPAGNEEPTIGRCYSTASAKLHPRNAWSITTVGGSMVGLALFAELRRAEVKCLIHMVHTLHM